VGYTAFNFFTNCSISVCRDAQYDALQPHACGAQHANDVRVQHVHGAQLLHDLLQRVQHERVCDVQRLSRGEQRLFRDDRVS
jgi:hypothetical protein